MNHKKIVLLCVVGYFLLLPVLGTLSFARDPENCLFCHKYRRLGGYDEREIMHKLLYDYRMKTSELK